MYRAGLHLISEFKIKNPELLKDSQIIKTYFDSAIVSHKLCKVGEVYHQFPQGGYTGVICLTESHIAIHTWPEFNRVTFDVFLSNFMNYNDATAEAIHNDLLLLLDATDVNVTKLKR